ncbi:unnamed protein product [Musa acuminata subsp. malaccensis]|uniref:(wild Malaysian banana) hypothetical protein n=1 Tax=Musa acuminata subsp. malaccensis TaxID=214687 RepID=A0A804JJL5_MUSAM|nr:PREDICTED: putative receptor-like protein kinase At4g00960 [Musa acuminata subsp. malaccensis]CAG1847242.1 unnamed protein product [Musa acuminata subsp. malaccensis]
MSPSSLSPFLKLLLLLLLFSVISADPLYNICGTTGNFSANSTYQTNLNLLLSRLASNVSASGFINDTVGRTPDQVYGFALCRGDVNSSACGSCVDTATQDIQQMCAYNKAAVIWYDFCLLRFSNGRIFSYDGNSPEFYMWNVNNITRADRFSKLLDLLLNRTTDRAANSAKKFATGTVSNFTSTFPMVYGLVQCTPDLSQTDCGTCLRGLYSPLPKLMVGKEGGRVIGVRCNMRFEVYSFYQGNSTLALTAPVESASEPTPPPASPPLATPAVPQRGKKKNAIGIVLAIVIPAATAVLLLISIVCVCYWRKRKRIPKPPYETDGEQIPSVESLLFDLLTIRLATANFSTENKIGEGGFGTVYMGLLPDGREIAVKRLSNSSGQGLGELKNELVLVAKLQHRNLVKLLGVCLEEEKMIIYEYVPNGSLDAFLFDPTRGQQLRWGIRYKIIAGIARGLLYLHEESQLRIIHRDLKASNILLDAEMNPKISDFGLAKLFGGDQTQGTTSRVVGTFGYMAPEYAMQGKFSIKSDVFSFGVLVLEILTGRKNSSTYDSDVAEDLLSYIWEKWRGGRAMEIVDPALGGRYQGGDVLRCVQIGLLCVQENPNDRPTMSTVVVMLNSETVSLQPPARPAFCAGKSDANASLGSSNSTLPVEKSDRQSKSFPMSPNEVSVSEIEPR